MRTLLVVVVVALIAGSIWWPDVFERPLQPDTPPAAPQQAPAAVVAPAEAPLPTASAASTSVAAEKAERTAVTAPEPARPEHTLRGRAIDANGQPLAGVSAGLTGWIGNSERLAEWTKNNAEPERIEMKATTEADGVFTFRCWPPPPFQFSLRLQGSRVATWSNRWSEWEPGGTTDLGDVKLERGTLLRGRVVDSTGAPVATVDVRVDASTPAAARQGFETSCAARTGDDGAFVQHWPLLPGEYTIGIRDQQIERGEKVTLTGEPEQFVDVVVKRIDPAESISGVVVDDSGAPLRGAWVLLAGTSLLGTTDAKGRFRVRKHAGSPPEIALSVRMDGHESPSASEEVAWGRHDVRIVMTRGKELVVLAVSAADGGPVENYVLRVFPTGDGWISSRGREPRSKPPHKDGRATARGITAGKHRVVVEPQGDGFAIGVVTIEVGPNGALPVTVRLAATEPRIVRVVFADGATVAGAKVQLVDACGEPWNEKTPVYSLKSRTYPTAHALELAAAVTDANGECTLPVPGDRPLALMLQGPGHMAHAVQPAVFPADGPLVVTVSSGATLRGQLGPEAAWAELKRLAGGDGNAQPGRLPSVTLHRGDGRASERFPDSSSQQTVKPDGSFELIGIPPGRWDVSVSYFPANAGVAGQGGWFGKQEPAGKVDLVDGQVTTIAPDLSSLLPGTLEALVLHNGAPLANTLVSLERLMPGAKWAQPEAALTTDAEGRLRGLLRGGEYRASLASTMVRSLETAIVSAGATAQQKFTLVSGTVKVRLVDSSGAPVVNVHIALANAEGALTEGLGATGADGRIEKKVAPGTFTASVAPKRLQDQKALLEFYRTATDPAAMQRVLVTLGTITVRAGETTEVELRLPADW